MPIADVLVWPETITTCMTWKIQPSSFAIWDDHHCAFQKCSPSNKYIYHVVYVDDIVITGDDRAGIKALKQTMPISKFSD